MLHETSRERIQYLDATTARRALEAKSTRLAIGLIEDPDATGEVHARRECLCVIIVVYSAKAR